MREIKFRAWDERDKRMYVGDEFEELNENLKTFVTYDGKFEIGLFDEHGDYRELLPMQYTGLKDRNGKEIYEGDAVKNHHRNCGELLQVKWQEAETEQTSDGIWWTKEKPGFRFVRIGGFGTTVYVADKDFEVVGNIYENPELLQGESHATGA